MTRKGFAHIGLLVLLLVVVVGSAAVLTQVRRAQQNQLPDTSSRQPDTGPTSQDIAEPGSAVHDNSLAKKVTTSECVAMGGEVINTLSNPGNPAVLYSEDAILGTITGVRCPCICVKKSGGGVDIKNWQTYRNDVYGIEIQHPPAWSVSEENKDFTLRDRLKRYSGDYVVVTVLDGKLEGRITAIYLGTDLNSSDCPSRISREECLRLRETNKMGLDQFVEFASRNDGFRNIKKTVVNGRSAYEFDSVAKIKITTGETYREEKEYKEYKEYSVMVETKDGVFHIMFANRTKGDLSPIERQILSTIRFAEF